MIKGMTGFGTAELSAKDFKATIEIKSVNHRYFDANYYFPNSFNAVESKIKNILQNDLHRGRITVAIKLTQKSEQNIHVNHRVIKEYVDQSVLIQKKYKLENSLTVSDVIHFPGVIETKDVPLDISRVWPKVELCLKKALRGLMTMRKREGKSLAADVAEQLKQMAKEVAGIQKRTKDVLSQKKKQLTDEEFSSYQKGCDVNEELSRLSHYMQETKKLLRTAGPVGKKIDFIAQEMQRETNTIGSKQQDKLVTNAVINLKSKIEKIREQAQNIE